MKHANKQTKTKKNWVFVTLLALMGMIGGTQLSAGDAWADCGLVECAGGTLAGNNQCGNDGFMGFRPWFKGLVIIKDGKCEVGQPKAGDDNFAAYVWTIILNVLVDIFSVAGILAMIFITYGGYFYIRSGGDPSRVVKGKKIIIASVSGLIIIILASVISNTLILVLQGASS